MPKLNRLMLILSLTMFVMLPAVAVADIRIASFNVRNYGWNNGKDYAQLATILNRFDLIAIQEVMDPEQPQRMAKRLTQMTGDPWQEMTSHLIGRSTYKEAYTFLWRDSAVEYVDGAVVYLDDRDTFAREPFSARFRSRQTGTLFAMSNIHVLYGDSIRDRLPEIHALARYWDWLSEIYPDTPRILAGDFNLSPHHDGWQPLIAKGARPAIQDGATTLSTTDGRYANLYDNLWHVPGKLDINEVGIFRFPQTLGISHEQARDTISDHAPVYLALGKARVDTAATERVSHQNTRQTKNCIDLNRASITQLNDLPHVGEARAEAIIALRPWESVNDLTRVRGLSESRVADIKAHASFCQ